MELDETRWMLALQSATKAAVGPATTLSAMGEHALAWLALSGLGVAVDRPRRVGWAAAGLSAFLAHAAAVAVKRVVRRPRPAATRLHVLVSTPSDLSFPSAHVASTTAMAVACTPILGIAVPAAVAAAQMAGRVILGVHYPTDVVAGAALGALVAVGVRHSFARAGFR